MSPRILKTDKCVHCGVALEQPTPRLCPKCGGSLQQRYLKWGCLSSKPLVLLVGLGAGLAAALALAGKL
ncbi:MAG: hypothetical protein EPO68_00060 [Planctomycetota bacterium]|nr:MAG: hypothetical protein EPO68_00060 [Planctomycetota bacterium]